MTYGEALRQGTEYLQECGIEEASVDAWYLMEYCCKMTRTRYLMEKMSEIPEEQHREYQELLKRRGTHIPLQHITGEQEFMGLTFLVNDQVLVPRQDTEILVEEALKVLKPGMRVLDMCTGSGCIIISLLKYCQGLEGHAVDLSAGALEVAAANAKKQEVAVNFRQSDLFEQVEEKFHVIVSNPPYIPTDVIEHLMEEVRFHDPMMALDGKEDGLYFYREIIKVSHLYLEKEGWLMFEIGSDQGEAVANLMKEAKYTRVRVIKDLAGHDRVVVGCREI